MWAESLVAPKQWDLPRPEIEPVSPALAGGFSTTQAQGKSCLLFNECSNQIFHMLTLGREG